MEKRIRYERERERERQKNENKAVRVWCDLIVMAYRYG